MAHDGENKSDAGKLNSTGALGWVDRAWECKLALRLTCVALFVDLATIQRTGQGVLDVARNGGVIWQHLGYVLVAAAIFGLLVSIAFPLMAAMLAQLLRPAFDWVSSLLFPTVGIGHRIRYADGLVGSGKLLEYALRERDQIALERHKEHAAEKEESDRWVREVANLVFGALLLAFFDWMVAAFGWSSSSVVHSILRQLGETGGCVMVIAVVFGGMAVLKAAWFPPYESARVYYPPLADKLAAEERKRRRAELDLDLKFYEEAAARRRAQEE